MNRNLRRLAYRPRKAAEVTAFLFGFFIRDSEKDLPTVRVGRCRLVTEQKKHTMRGQRSKSEFKVQLILDFMR
jgi:hypothetical protein